MPRKRSRGLGADSLERPRPLKSQREIPREQRPDFRITEVLYDKVVARQGELARARRGFAALAPGGTERTDWRGDQLNVAFSCWRGLASSVKARQRLYRRKMQGRASPLQRDVRMALFFCFNGLRCRSLKSWVTGRPAVVYRRHEDRRRRPQVPSVVHDLGADEFGLTAVLKPGASLTCRCEVEEAGPELVLKRRNTSNRWTVV